MRVARTQRRNEMIKKILILCLLSSGIFAAENPAVIWQSIPVNPGEAVMVYGGPWSSNAVVELFGAKKEIVQPISVTANCLTFVYPDGWKLSELTAKIVDNGGSVSTTINSADVWWMQGDAGRAVSPGGWLRIFGRCIGYNDKAYVEFKREGQNVKVLAVDFDLYSMKLHVPASLATGDYQVFINNGLGKKAVFAGDLSVVNYKEPWFGKKVYNVEDYGAIANDRIDDSRAIFAALADLKAASGGVLYFPRGRFGINGSIELPPNSAIRGAGMELSQIYWPDEDNPVGALISGKYNFGVEDIFIISGNFDKGIYVDSPTKDDDWKNEDIIIRNVRMRLLHTDTVSKEESTRRLSQNSSAFTVRGSFIRIIGCDIVNTKGVVNIHGDYLFVKGNRMLGSGKNQSLYIGGHKSVIEDNDFEGTSCSMGNGNMQLILKNNKLGAVYGDGDRETFTFDGGRTTYNDTVVAVTQNGMELKAGAWRDSEDAWIGKSVCIIGGQGAGQHRFVSKIDGRKVELDKPWAIMPDDESFFVIGKARHKLLFIDNHCGDGNPFQLYGSATDVVIAGNKIERNGALHAYGMTKGGSPEPSWFIQFLDNEILEGNAVRGPWSFMVPAADAYLAFFDRGMHSLNVVYPLSRVGVMRRNILHNNAYIYSGWRVDNMLVENNVIKNADRGVVAKSKGLVVRGNSFEEVLNPYDVVQIAIFSPAEKFAANLQAIDVVMKSDVPKNWSRFVQKAQVLSKKNISINNLNKAIGDLREQAAVALSKHVGDKVIDATVIKMLLGLDVSQNSVSQFGRLIPEKDTIVRVGGKKYPESGLEAVVSGETAGFKNWTIGTQKNLKLIPGNLASYQLNIKRPVGDLSAFKFPIGFKVSGNNWSFNFKEEYGNDQLRVTNFLVAGPFKNSSGKSLDTEVHPPEMNLNVTHSYETLDGKKSWRAVTADTKGNIDLKNTFKNSDMSTACAIAVVRASKPILVTVNYGRHFNTLLIVNGKRIGSSARRPGPANVYLEKGDNLFQMISSHASGRWPFKLKLTVVDSVEPSDLKVLSVKELQALPLLNKDDEKGKLTNSLGRDWELIVDDNFNRIRVGQHLIGKFNIPSYRSADLTVEDGQLGCRGGTAKVFLNQPISAPVRIEFDVWMGTERSGWGVDLKNSQKITPWEGYSFNGTGIGNRTLSRNEAMVVRRGGVYPGVKAGVWNHVVVQIVPPRIQFYFNGVLKVDYEDSDWIENLDDFSFWLDTDVKIDNLKIYEAK